MLVPDTPHIITFGICGGCTRKFGSLSWHFLDCDVREVRQLVVVGQKQDLSDHVRQAALWHNRRGDTDRGSNQLFTCSRMIAAKPRTERLSYSDRGIASQPDYADGRSNGNPYGFAAIGSLTDRKMLPRDWRERPTGLLRPRPRSLP